jgi:hypothetical protein
VCFLVSDFSFPGCCIFLSSLLIRVFLPLFVGVLWGGNLDGEGVGSATTLAASVTGILNLGFGRLLSSQKILMVALAAELQSLMMRGFAF